MKAIILKGFGGAEMMVFGDADMPLPAVGQILIQVVATSVNRADIVATSGELRAT